MITLIYIILIYILFGSIVYLFSRYFVDQELSHFMKLLFWILEIVFKPIIVIIMNIDFYKAINKFDKQVRKIIINSDYSKEEINEFIRNSDKYSDEDKERLINYNNKLFK